jgi:hypothetical protein
MIRHSKTVEPVLDCQPSSNQGRARREAAVWRAGTLIACIALLVSSSPVEAAIPGTWSPTGSMRVARATPAATLLQDGTLLVAGGRDASDLPLASAELYHPTTRTWTLTGSMSVARDALTATVLPNGQVLVEGGAVTTGGGATVSAELYDPPTRRWHTTGSLNNARVGHTATLLPNGLVLVVGGSSSGATVTSAELYDPASGTWHRTSAPSVQPITPGGAVLLPTGKVLVLGDRSFQVAGAALYDPDTNSWSSTGSPSDFFLDATLLQTGKVLVESGVFGSRTPQLYDPATGTWTSTASGSFSGAIAALLPDGNALSVSGGRLAKLYDPLSGTWSATGTMTFASLGIFALLEDGTVLGAGGVDPTTLSTSKAVAEIYTPGAASALPSSCVLAATRLNATGQVVIKVAARDIASGLQSIKVLTATNATVSLPQFPTGSRNPAVVTATKVNSGHSAVLKLEVINRAGKTLTCDPVVAELTDQRGENSRQVFSNLRQAESKVQLINGTPGLDRVRLRVNGRRFELDAVENGEQRSVDVASAMRPGADNTLVVRAYGPRGGRAALVITD